jgi:hypothetical protein
MTWQSALYPSLYAFFIATGLDKTAKKLAREAWPCTMAASGDPEATDPTKGAAWTLSWRIT